MEKVRGFEMVSGYKGQEALLMPRRSTRHSAGYDFFAAEDTLVHSMKKNLNTVLVSTGVKAYMPENEYLMLVIRSSSPRKHRLILPNSVGIIDADYYNNIENEGEIFLQLMNFGSDDYLIKKGDRICQGIFTPYFLADQEIKPQKKRQGGFGSSGH